MSLIYPKFAKEAANVLICVTFFLFLVKVTFSVGVSSALLVLLYLLVVGISHSVLGISAMST